MVRSACAFHAKISAVAMYGLTLGSPAWPRVIAHDRRMESRLAKGRESDGLDDVVAGGGRKWKEARSVVRSIELSIAISASLDLTSRVSSSAGSWMEKIELSRSIR
jgi:hypothetical protein